MNGTLSDTIEVFDVDGTLIDSGARVILRKADGTIRRLSQDHFEQHELLPGESFDFREFDSAEVLSKSKFLVCWQKLVDAYNDGRHVCLLTARAHRKMLRDFFKEHGVDIHQSFIFTVNGPESLFTGKIHDRKWQAVRHLVKLGYRNIIAYDDNERNLFWIKQCEHADVHVKAMLASRDGAVEILQDQPHE